MIHGREAEAAEDIARSHVSCFISAVISCGHTQQGMTHRLSRGLSQRKQRRRGAEGKAVLCVVVDLIRIKSPAGAVGSPCRPPPLLLRATWQIIESTLHWHHQKAPISSLLVSVRSLLSFFVGLSLSLRTSHHVFLSSSS